MTEGSGSDGVRSLSGEASAAAFPLGGIGTGNVSIGARGELRDWELANRPDKGRSLPFTFFSIRVATGEESHARVLESRLRPPHQFDQGYAAARVAGLPRFRESRMEGAYPILDVAFEDDALPVDVTLTAFTPLVPLDVPDSGIPAAVLRYRVTNRGTADATVSVAGSITNPVGLRSDSDLWFPEFEGRPRIDWRDDGSLRGLHCSSDLEPDSLAFGTVSLTTDAEAVTGKPTWLVGFWNDGAQRFWDDFRSDGRLEAEAHFSLDTDPGAFLELETDRPEAADLEGRLTRIRTGSLAIERTLAPGESAEFPFYLSWHFPNRSRGWNGHIIRQDPNSGERVRNAYALRFADSWEAARHLVDDLPRLEALTRAFTDALYRGSLPGPLADAAGANLAVLRSSTCMLLEGDVFAAWEGSFDHAGSCEGTCTHVWNYAQSAAFLFPSLERSARRTEFLLETDAAGSMQFRTNRVFGGPRWNMLPAVDGQLGTIVRLYRDWRFSGDDDFLRELWEPAVRALEFALRHWDTDGDGILDGRQHTTYDIEFYGPDPLGNTLLLAALRAAGRLAEHLGESERAARYDQLADSCAERMDALLFNGEYYEQRTPPGDAHRYQYGSGVLSDQLFGQLLAHVCGLGHLLPVDHVRSALGAVFAHNFRSELAGHESVQRTYALGDEGGLLMCSWPRGGRPAFPFIYSDEVWPGVEHQVAAHLIYEGRTEQGLTVVTALRDRHDGIRRSPWNEPECGNHYARSLASWALLLAATGCSWDAPRAVLSFDPRWPGELVSFFSTNGAWGTVRIDRTRVELEVIAGTLRLRGLVVAGVEVALPGDSVESVTSAGETLTLLRGGATSRVGQ